MRIGWLTPQDDKTWRGRIETLQATLSIIVRFEPFGEAVILDENEVQFGSGRVIGDETFGIRLRIILSIPRFSAHPVVADVVEPEEPEGPMTIEWRIKA